MVRTILYHQECYTAAAACLDDVGLKVERGWQVSRVARCPDGSYEVAFRLEQNDGHVTIFQETGGADGRDGRLG